MTLKKLGTKIGRTPRFGWAGEEAARAAVRRIYEEEGLGMTVRHFYYRLLSLAIIQLYAHELKSADCAYNKVGDLLKKMRWDGSLPWRAVIDPSRRCFTHWSYTSLAHSLRLNQLSLFHADIWRGQPRKLEVWVEKDAMADFVNQVCGAYRIPVYVAKGYGSQTLLKQAADRYGCGKGWTLLYCGDFDPSGLDIQRNLRDTLGKHGSSPQIERIALTRADTLAMPEVAALAVKKDDPRYKGFIQTWGKDQKAYELDALAPHLLRDKLHEAIGAYFDRDAFEQARAIEAATDDLIERALQDVFSGLNERVLAEGLPDLDLDDVPLAIQRLYLSAPGSDVEGEEVGDIDVDDDDNEDDDDDDAERAAWEAYQAAEGDPTADPAEVERLRDVWYAFYTASHPTNDDSAE